MNEEFWRRNPKVVAHELLGKVMVVGGVEAVILKAEGFAPHVSDRGLYKPFYETEPGEARCPRLMNSVLLVFSAYEQGKKGGRVLIRTAEIDGHIYEGPGRVTQALGILETNTRGTVAWIDEDRFRLILDVPPQPKSVPAKNPRRKPHSRDNKIGKEALKRLMPEIVEKYLKEKKRLGAVNFEEYLNQLLETSSSIAELRKKLQ